MGEGPAFFKKKQVNVCTECKHITQSKGSQGQVVNVSCM